MTETNLIKFAAITKSRKSAMEFLCNRFKKFDKRILCTYCKHDEYYVQTRERLRCTKCRKDYRPLNNTYFRRVKISFQKWLILIKLSKLGVSANKATEESGVSYPAAHSAFDCMRFAIVCHLALSDHQLRGEIEAA